MGAAAGAPNKFGCGGCGVPNIGGGGGGGGIPLKFIMGNGGGGGGAPNIGGGGGIPPSDVGNGGGGGIPTNDVGNGGGGGASTLITVDEFPSIVGLSKFKFAILVVS